MSGIEVTSSKRNSFPHLSFESEMKENDQTLNKHFDLKRELVINALKQNKYIAPIIKIYQSQENELNKKLPEIAIKTAVNLISDSNTKYEATENFKENLRKVISSYGYFNDEFVTEISNWLERRQMMVEHLQGIAHMLRLIKQTTSTIALISSTMDLARGIGTFLYTYFEVNLKPKYSFLLAWLIGGISVTSSVLALSYTKQSAEDIFRDLREEKYLLRDLLITDRKGNAVDEDVKDLFPHGIDLDLVKEITLDSDENFMDDMSLKQYISFAILLPNFKKNRKLMDDAKFLASVKLFVESAAAKIWLYRIKLHKLLDDTITNLEIHLAKKIFTGNEIFNQTAVNLYSIFFPLFVEAKNMEKFRFICSSIVAISAIVNLSHDSTEEFQDIRRTSEILFNDYKNLRRFSQEFMNEYD